MARLIYTAITSLDGYINDEQGNFEWAEPAEDLHQFFNDLERPIGVHLYGRRLYETMAAWESDELIEGQPDVMADYAQVWRAAEKKVYSTTLTSVSTARTTLESTFDPDAIRELKWTSPTDISVGGPGLAAEAFAAGLVDELGLVLFPEIVGGGTRFLPDHLRLSLELITQRNFDNGVTYLSYRVKN